MNKNTFIVSILIIIIPITSFAQLIKTIAGSGTSLGDEGPATAAQVIGPYCGAFDMYGNYYFGQSFGAPRIRMIDTDGIIHTVAGNGTNGFSGDGGIATSAQFNQINGMTVDSIGNIYISDLQNYRIRKVDATTHIITTIAGTGVNGYSGDGGPAINAAISPAVLCVDKYGNIYFVDKSERIRKIATNGVINTIAGTGIQGFSGDGGNALNANLDLNQSICIDMSGNLLFGCNLRIRKIDLSSGIISTIGGTGNYGYNGDEIPASAANFGNFGICIDKSNNLYIADYGGNRIRQIDIAGMIHTVAGNGVGTYTGDGGNATNASIFHPEGVAIDQCGNLYIADEGNDRIRKVTFHPNCFPENVNQVNATNEITIYPNPAKDQLTITAGSDVNEVMVLNAMGQILIAQKNYKGNKAIVNVSRLAAGVYFVKVSDKDGNVATKRFVKE
ncbi:MAG: T9SS type A sorting domain-containing protein [Bacteroidetes bacterium]|nr:T9SS type A sorting domain-containing protein [Bacteroidota bacterium]